MDKALSGSAAIKAPPLLTLVLLSMAGPIAINIIVPSMPAMVDVFDASYGAVQLSLSLFLFTIAASQLISGPLSDRYGRRSIILLGMSLGVVGSLICSLSTSLEVFLLGRVVQAAGASTGITLARTIIRDLYDRDKAASMIGYVTMGMALGPMVAPFLGGVLQEYIGWWASSLFIATFCFIMLILAIRTLHETNQNLGGTLNLSQMAHNYVSLVRSRIFLSYGIIGAFTTATFFSFVGSAPLVADVLFGLSAVDYGLYFIIIPLGYSIGNFLSGRYTSRVGLDRMMLIGCCLALASLFVIAGLFAFGFSHPYSLFIPMGLMCSVAHGLVLPAIISGGISVYPTAIGTASGLITCMQMTLGGTMSALAGYLLSIMPSIWMLIAIMMVCSSVALITCFLSRAITKNT